MLADKKLLAAFVITTFAGNAVAADLSAPGGAIPAYFAKEIVASADAPRTLTTSAAGAGLTWKIGYNFSQAEVRYMRIECSDTLSFDPATTIALGDPAAGNVGSINGVGSNVITFSITSTGGPGNNIVDSDVLTVVGNHAITGTYRDVDCEVALYDLPSSAQAGGPGGRIANTRLSGAYLAFVPSYELVALPSQHVSNINTVPSFSAFVSDPPQTTLTTANLGAGSIAYGVRDPDGAGGQSAPFGVNGIELTLPDILAPATTVIVSGDYTIAGNATAPVYAGAALGRVRLNGANAAALTASEATFNVGNTPFAGASMALTRQSGPIPAGVYTAALAAVSANPALYAVSNLADVTLGSISRNAAQLQAPLVDVPEGWISRLVLTNAGSVDRPYVIAVYGEAGNTISTANRTGTIRANSTMVIEDLKSVLTGFTRKPRATLEVTVAGPNSQIQGAYQVVDPQSGTISNHVLVRPGTN